MCKYKRCYSGLQFHDIVQNREVNAIIIHAKHYIFKCHFNEKDLNMPQFCNYLIKYILHFKTLLEGTRYQITGQTIENLINILQS